MSSSAMDTSAVDLTQSNYIQAQLKTILQDVAVLEEGNQDNMQTIDKTTKIITQVETMYKEMDTKNNNFGESYLDSQVLCATSFLAIRCADAASGNLNEYDRHDLATHMSSNPDFWEFKLPYEAPPVTYLYGTFAPTAPELRPKAPRRRVERQAAAAMKVPEKIASTDKSTRITEIVNKVHNFLDQACQTGPLCYFQVALDPTSFSKTVENIYYLSFLAKDGRMEIFIDSQTGLPRIKTRPPEEQDVDKENHFIASIDMKLWRDLVKAFKIKKPMMVIPKN